MRWMGGRRSQNVEDRRGQSAGGFGGGGFRLPGGFGRGGGGGRRIGIGGGIGGIVVVLILLFLGVDPSVLLQGGDPGYVPAPTEQQSPTVPGSRAPGPQAPGQQAQDQQSQFVSVVLADTEDTWREIFQRSGQRYVEPKLVLFSGAINSACGFAQAAVGPFYCPNDMKVSIDLSFYNDLKSRIGAPGDFAQAYVIAHEVGHHVQRLTGVLERVQKARQQMNEAQGNALQVRVELQADCYAGVWAHHADRARGVVEPGDIDEALNAAAAIGDDRLQRRSRGYVSPESFTHGTSEQRARWFRRGFEKGEFTACDTFNAGQL
ncbi:MAG: putative neutral zinc metallopeptidase [Alphaproteobacteria bacterium]|nr:putative neutral zinc metallopeptidase [Alphaproteobacteria bacterium]